MTSIFNWPDLRDQLRWLKYNFKHRKHLAERTAGESLFAEYYETNEWGSTESKSGRGSELGYTEKLRQALPVLFEKYSVNVLLDAPCGDFNWFRHVTVADGFRYIGGDIVSSVVDRNRNHYTNQTRSFQRIDICQDPLPSADMWLCRDCLFHLGYRDIARALENFFNSGIPYLLTTTHYDAPFNFNILTGSFRPLNLQKAPFRFPAPLESIEDWIPGFPRRALGLWHRSALLEHRDFLKTLSIP